MFWFTKCRRVQLHTIQSIGLTYLEMVNTLSFTYRDRKLSIILTIDMYPCGKIRFYGLYPYESNLFLGFFQSYNDLFFARIHTLHAAVYILNIWIKNFKTGRYIESL